MTESAVISFGFSRTFPLQAPFQGWVFRKVFLVAMPKAALKRQHAAFALPWADMFSSPFGSEKHILPLPSVR